MEKQFLHRKNCRTSLSFVWMLMLLFGCLMGPVTAIHAEAEDFNTCDILTPLGTSFNLDLDGAGNGTIEPSKFVSFVASTCIPVGTLMPQNAIELWTDATATVPFTPTLVTCADVGTTFNVWVTVNSSQLIPAPVPECISTAIEFQVTVMDNMPPTITCPGNLTETGCLVTDVSAPYADVAAFIAAGGMANDNCGLTLTSVTTPTGGAGCPADPFTYDRVYTVTDPSGNAASCTQMIKVVDDVAPTVVCVAGTVAKNLDANCEATFTAAELDNGSSDNCTAAADLLIEIKRAGAPAADYAASITYTSADLTTCPSNFSVDMRVTDLCGNPTESLNCAMISINDVTPPTLTCPANEVILTSNDGTGDCAALATITPPTPMDNCGINNASYMIDIKDPSGNSLAGYPKLAVAGAAIMETFAKMPTCADDTYTVNYTVQDNCMNPANCSYTIRVRDDEAPIISGCPMDILKNTVPADCYATATWVAPTATDNCHPPGQVPLVPTLLITYPDGTTATSIDVIAGQSTGIFPKGSTEIKYTFTDCQNPMPNIAECIFNIIVTDDEDPTAMCVGDFTTTLGPLNPGESTDFTFADFDAGSFDNCMIVTKEISDDGMTFGQTLSYGCADAGTTKTITLRVTDMSGNTGTCTLDVTFLGGNLSAATSTTIPPSGPSCNGGKDGSIYINVTGGSEPYGYQWSGPNLANVPADEVEDQVGNLAAGTYGVTVTDANGCTTSVTGIVLTEPTAVTVTIGNVINADCAGNETGSATATAGGGTGPYTYSWSNGQTTATATNLHAGGYIVLVTDANGCTAAAATSISDPNGLELAAEVVNDVSCNGGNDGSVTLAMLALPTSGTPPYTVLSYFTAPGVSTPVNMVFPGGGISPVTISGLSAGQHWFVVEDANGCRTVTGANVDEPTLLIAETIATTDALCNGSLDGTATVNATGGTTPYLYAWSSGANTATATGLAAGTYTVTVTDANLCTATSMATIGEPTPLNAFVNLTTNVSCNGGSDGSIHIGTDGGTSPYKYQWDGLIPADNVQDALNIPAGSYTVTVTDANQCSTVISNINITEPSPVVVTIGNVVNADCQGNETGSAVATASGGTGAIYNFAWSNGQNGTNQATATGLHAGGYSVTVTDEAGCTAQASVSISDPNGIVAGVTVVDNVTCNGGNDGRIVANVTANPVSGTSPYNFLGYYTNGLNFVTLNTPLTNTLFGDYTAILDNLEAGHYELFIQDANGCTVALSATVDEPTLLIAETIATTDALCNGSADGTATVNATGGTTAYTYLWSDGQTTATATGLAAGTYGVTVTDANGCTAETSATIGEPAALTISLGAAFDVSCNGGFDGSIYINNPVGGTGPFNYEWTSNTAFVFDQAADNAQDQVNNLPAGSYNVEVTDANGCTFAINDIVINEPTLLTVSIGNVTNADCQGNETGSATATAAGGTGPYTYAWSNGDNTATASNLHAGGYTVIATDANGCTAMASTAITDPNGLVFDIIVTANVTCNGGNDGIVALGIEGGTSPYSLINYIGPDFATVVLGQPIVFGTPIFGLSAGSHTFVLVDDNGCLAVAHTIITEPTAVFAEIIHQEDVTCPGGSDGEATVNATGGTTDYTYLWSNGQTSNTATGLTEGFHSVTVTDANGCTDDVTVAIIQVDDVAPEFVTTIPGDETVECDAIPAPFVVLPQWHTTDNCSDPANITVDYTETIQDVVCPNTYTIKRRWTITDEAGNTAFHIQKIYVQDTTKPTFTVPADVTIECDESTAPSNTGDVTDQMDNCSAPANVVVAYTDVDDYSGCGGYTGTITRTWTATDECGNVENKVQIITIIDTVKPIAACQDITIQLDANGQASITVADIENGSSDNCASYAQLTFALDKTDFTCADLGANIVKLTVTDPCGNFRICSATVTVEDNILPVITCPGDMVINLDPGACDQVISFDVLATDNCDVTVAQIGGTLSSGDAFPIGGPYVLTYEATDAAGNTAQCSFSVTVNEFAATSNDITCNTLVHVSLDENCIAIVDADMILEGNNYGCYDNYIVSILDVNGNVVPGNILNQAYVGQTLEVSVTNPSGNSCWGNLIVEDKLIPTFDVPADVTVLCNDQTSPAYTGEAVLTSCEAGATITYEDVFTDYGCDGAPFDSEVRAIIVRTWTVTDDSGNSATGVQTITIGKTNLELDLVWPTNKDAIDAPALDCADVAANPGLTGPAYTGYPQYNGYDIQPGGLCSISIGYEDAILDICSGGSSYEILRTWTVRDMCKPLMPGWNPLSYVQSIKVLDTTGPSITPAPSFTLSPGNNNCEVNANIPAASISDDCSGYTVYMVTPNGIVNSNGGFIPGTFGLGDHTVTFIATDACGNVSSEDFTFSVEDQTPPIAVCDVHTVASIGSDGYATIHALTFDDGSYDNCSDITFEVRKMTDACGIPANLVFGPSVSFCCAEVGSTLMVELKVTDANGLSNSCMVEVEVQDKLNPIIICKPDVNINCDNDILDEIAVGQPLSAAAIALLGEPIATDNCDVTISSNVILNTVDNCGNGEIKIAWSATDPQGNFDGCFQSIFVANNDVFTITDTECNSYPLGALHSLNDDVEWPCDIELTTCGLGLEPADLEANYPQDARPILSEGTCDNIAMTHEDQVLEFGAADACLKILRKWIIIDWCQAAANQDPTQPGPGVWHYTQVIKVINSNDPNITPVNLPGTIDNFDPNCGAAFAAFEITADDDCTAQSDLEVTWAFNTGLTGSGLSASGAFNNGSYSLTFTVNDQCGNTSTLTHNFTVRDAKKPTPVCLFGIASVIMPSSGAVTIWASDFESGSSYDNCTAYNNLIFSFSPVIPGQLIEDNIEIACADVPVDGLYPITLYVTDAYGNYDYCSTFINVQDPNGACAGPTALISGTIENENQEVVEEVTVNLTNGNGPIVTPVVTGVDGTFQFNMNYGDYDVTPEKNINYLNGVTTFDLVLISKHILGLELLDSPYKLIAADANHSETITTLDMVKIRRLILHMDDELANNTSWRFVDANYTFNNPANPLAESFPEFVELDGAVVPANFVAIKVGDVNGSSSPNSLLGTETRSFDGKLALQLEDAEVPAGETFTVDFRAKDFNNIAGYQFSLGFDNSVIDFVDVTTNLEGLDIENFGLTKLDEGVITTSWNSNKEVSMENEAILFSVTFQANAATTIKDVVSINSRYTAAEAYKSSDLLDVVLEFNGEEVANGFELYQNTPNPFKVETTIGFNLPTAGNVTLKVYDVSGRVLRLMEIEGVKGFNSVQMDRGGLDATGVLYYQLETATETATKKMIIVD